MVTPSAMMILPPKCLPSELSCSFALREKCAGLLILMPDVRLSRAIRSRVYSLLNNVRCILLVSCAKMRIPTELREHRNTIHQGFDFVGAVFPDASLWLLSRFGIGIQSG